MFVLFLEFRAGSRPQDLWPFLISETGLKFLIWTQGETGPGNHSRGPFLVSPGNFTGPKSNIQIEI